MLVKTYSSAVYGVNAKTMTVEVNVDVGQGFFIVGLPDNAIKESALRIDAALKNSNYAVTRKRVVVNLAPADIKKEGSSYDLPISLGLMAATGQVEAGQLDKLVILGELGLDGRVLPIKGALPMAIQARKEGFEGMILPLKNAKEAAIVDQIKIYGIEHISEAVEFLNGERDIVATEVRTREEFMEKQGLNTPDFSDVKGQANIKRALEIAAAGGHNVILIGPPGAGKTMLAKRLPGILPPLTLYEALEATKIHSVAGRLNEEGGLLTTRPFRAPHHSISDAALVGGGGIPQPGEISLAHNGVLFLDELPEYKRTVLEVMRQPLEDRKVVISRAKMSVEYPANFMLVASMNPCPCGYYNHPEKECSCSPQTVQRYLNKISGPLLDRIDLHVEVIPVSFSDLAEMPRGEGSDSIRNRVISAREIQKGRYDQSEGVYNNSMMSSRMVQETCVLTKAGHTLLKTAMERLNLSARAYDRILKVSRTIADLDGAPDIKVEHLAEAIQYRSLDRESWAG